MNTPKPMLTLSQVMQHLREKGITREIRMNEQKEMILQDSEITYEPQDLKILKTYRFEGPSDPADNVALYLAEDKDGKKAYIIDSYGPDSNYDGQEFDNFIKEVPTEDQPEWSFE